MGKIILSMMVSLDGYMESNDPAEDWVTFDDEVADYMMEFMNSTEAFIYGRKSYEAMIQYWPQRSDAFADVMNSKPKMIFSKTLKSVEWNSRLYAQVDKNTLLSIKKNAENDIALFAGADIASTFIQLDLIDEFRLMINPIVLGTGKPIFKDITQNLKLKLVKTRAFACGDVLLRYEKL